MLRITVPGREYWNESEEEFVRVKETNLSLEHSLVSISKWEAKWHKAFLGSDKKSTEEIVDYIRCMTLTQNVDPEIYNHLSPENITAINEYIENPMTATSFREDPMKKSGREVVTSEIIYYWMTAFNIPSEYQKWHLNRLLTLIRICIIKNQPHKKRSKKEIMARNAALNAARRQQLNTKG